MYESLKKHSEKFHLYIFAFDDTSYDLLNRLRLDYVTVISLEEFEDDALLAIKDSRSIGEYCWTCTPSTIKYCIEKYDLPSCTYLDADIYFYSNPAVLIEEMGDDSVLITEHKYTPECDFSDISGKYCVQFMTFKNDINGNTVLNWWREACIDWCYARHEDGKFGDQKYLDDWTERFHGVHVLVHPGGGVAPWNIQSYDLASKNFDLIFYHFQNFDFLENNRVSMGPCKIGEENIQRLYVPYIKHLQDISQQLKKIDNINDYNGIVKKRSFHWKDGLRYIKRKLTGTYNVYSLKKLIG